MPESFEPFNPEKIQLDGHFYAHGMYHKYTGLADEAAYFLTTQVRKEGNVILYLQQNGFLGATHVK